MSNTKVVMSQASNQYVAPTFIEDVFSTYLYTGTSAALTITNGIDLAGEGGLVWLKTRSSVFSHKLIDTEVGLTKTRSTNGADADLTYNPSFPWIASFDADGFTLGSNSQTNFSGVTYASWTFRKAPRFFDVVTYTGNGTDNRVIPHNLGSAPGFIVVKRTDSASNWFSYHRLIDSGENNVPIIYLNSTAERSYTGMAFQTQVGIGNSNNPALNFIVRTPANTNGATYVAYLFAHNDGDGDFGPDGDADIIKCGSFTSDGSGLATVDVGFEPQWVLYKGSTAATNWSIADSMRGFVADTASASGKYLNANSNSAELSSAPVGLTNTGFKYNSAPNIGFIYIAIRRGPMRAPESGTEVFKPLSETGTGASRTVDAGFPVDTFFIKDRNGLTGPTAGGNVFYDRLRGNSNVLQTQSTAAEAVSATYTALFNSVQNGVVLSDTWSSYGYREYCFRRAPNFFDVVAYTGDGTAGRTVPHNLGVAPEMMIIKGRNYTTDWAAYHSAIGNTKYLIPNTTAAAATGSLWWNNTSPTADIFTLGNSSRINNTSSNTYIAYLFATLAGVSKVGSYTGTGTHDDHVIDCGFTSGARFVLLKRTDAVSDWFVWDSARGITTGADPRLSLNTTAAEYNGLDDIRPHPSGFIAANPNGSDVNALNSQWIFYAIA